MSAVCECVCARVRAHGEGGNTEDRALGLTERRTGKASHLLPTVLLFEVETEVQSEIMIC